MHHIWISMYVFFNLRFPWCREHFKLQWVLCRLSLMNRLMENLIIVSMVVHLSSCLAEKAWIIIIGEVVLGFTDAVFISRNVFFLAALRLFVICLWWVVFSYIVFLYRRWWNPHGVSWKKSCLSCLKTSHGWKTCRHTAFLPDSIARRF